MEVEYPLQQKLQRTKSWKEYDANEEIPMILNEGYLPVKFQGSEFQEVDFEGALRFYYIVDGDSELTKAVQLTNKTTVGELIPKLVEKFSLQEDKQYSLYEISDGEQVTLLQPEECPLARAISTRNVPRFVLQDKIEDLDHLSNHNEHNIERTEEDPGAIISPKNGVTKSEKKKRLFSFSVGGVHKKDPSEKTDKKKNKSNSEKKSKKHKDKNVKNIDNDNELLSSEDELSHVNGGEVFEADIIDVNANTVESSPFSEDNKSADEYEDTNSPKTLLTVAAPHLEKEEKSVCFSDPLESEKLGNTKGEINVGSSILVNSENHSTKDCVGSPISVEPEIVAAEVSAPDYSLPDSFLDITDAEITQSNTSYDNKSIPITETVTESVEASVESTPEFENPDSNHPYSHHNIEEITESELTEEKTNRKLSFSNSSIFFEQDNNPPQLDIKTSLEKKKKKSRKSNKEKPVEKRSKSFSNMLKGQRKKDINKDGTLGRTELSTNKLTPGILKVFGDHVSKGSNYKAVRVSTISTSQEVVRMALEKYGFEDGNPKDYVLCDVVGQFTLSESATSTKGSKKQSKTKKTESINEEQPQWTTEYVRAIHENEKPLVLQSLWKPTNGRSRRFELRRRIDVESSCFFINTAERMGRSNSETSLFDDSDHSSVVSGGDGAAHTSPNTEKTEFKPAPLSPHSKSDRISSRQVGQDQNMAPLYTPYLLLIHGCKDASDVLIHKLDDPTVIVGPYMEGEEKQCNISLHASDILLPHCWIYKKVKLEEETAETNLDEINFLVFIEPANGADITINGAQISSTTLVKPGYLIGFGKQYLFIFKDPTQLNKPAFSLTWVDTLINAANSSSVLEDVTNLYAIPNKVRTDQAPSEDKAVQVELIEAPVFSENTEGSDEESDVSSDDAFLTKGHTNLAPRKQVNKSNLQLAYAIKDEEELLHTIIDIADEPTGDFKLTPAYFFMMAIEHSAATFTEIQTRKLLLKISSGLQGIAWEKTKEIGKQSSVKEEDPARLLDRVLPELKPVLFWMASALEMLHFLQCNLTDYLLPQEKVTTSKEALLTADEELLTVLEEVIMFTFQQTVYHLTKVLYVALPSIIDINPFQAEEAENENDNKQQSVHPAIEKIVNIFNSIFETAKEYQVHPQIISQLFAYLFFFSNASLFNTLMEKAPGGKFLRWTKGVQMRGNLDVLEDWAQSNGLAKPFEQHMSRFLAAVDLLSTPKVQIMQFDWKQMRMDFSALNPAQLQQLLNEYQLGGKPKPRSWYPPPEEVEPALRSSEILESFATHPPLMLPSTNFVLDLNNAPDSEEFSRYLVMINDRFNKSSEPKLSTDEEKIVATEIVATESAKPTKKSKKVRSRSNIDMEYVESAAKKEREKNAIAVNGIIRTTSNPQAQVGSIKSIQVQSKKSTTVTISSKSNKSEISQKSEQTDKNVNGVDDLIKQARVLINANDVTSDDEDVDRDLSGNLNGDDDVFVVDLTRGERGLGLGLIDGMFTSLKNNGIYVRTIVPNTPASEETRLRIGDQILAVNGTSLVGSDYSRAMELIKKAGAKLSFLIAKSDDDTMNQILTAST